MLSNSTMTKDQARRLIEECFSDLKDPADHGFVPESTRPDLEIAEQREVSRDLIQRRLQQIENQTYPADVRVRAMVLARQAGLTSSINPRLSSMTLWKAWPVPISSRLGFICSG